MGYSNILFYFSLLVLVVSCSQDKPKESSIDSSRDNYSVESSWKNEEKQEAMKNCLDSGSGNGNRSEFCACSVEILTSIFTYEEFYEFDKQIRQGKQPDPAISTRMIEMSKRVYSTCQ